MLCSRKSSPAEKSPNASTMAAAAAKWAHASSTVLLYSGAVPGMDWSRSEAATPAAKASGSVASVMI